MTLYLEEESDIVLPGISLEELARQVMAAVVDYENCPYECEVDLLLTDNQHIRELNRQFRQTDAPTDVLSFPLVSYEAPADFEALESACFHPETGELMLGDIVISKEMVLRQAEEYQHSAKREYAFLIAHSMLHLFGYDHMKEDERVVMEEKQRIILHQLGIER